MSEQVTHLAMLDDCRRLALETDEDVLVDPVRTVLDRRHDAARMGSLSRGNNENIIPMVKKAREHWDERAGEDLFERRFAFALGWHAHRATDRYFKPVFREDDPSYDDRDRNLIKVYHDAVVFEEVYGGGDVDPFAEGTMEVTMGSHPASDAIDVPEVEELFQAKWQVELLGAFEHVLDREDPYEWGGLSEFADETQQASYRTLWYEEANYDPDPHFLQQFINEPNFYDGTDPIVDLARSIQRGEETDVTLSEALEAPGDSHYAKALRRSFSYLEMASDYFDEAVTEREAAEHYGVTWLYETDEGEWDPAERPTDVDPEPHPRLHQPLSEVAAIQDVCRLSMVDGELSERVRDEFVDHAEAAVLGALVEPTDWTFGPLNAMRNEFWFRHPNAFDRMAIAVGSLVAETATERFGADRDSDERLRQDVRLLRARSADADPDEADADAVADLLAGLLPRSRQRWHTLKPDKSAVQEWSARFFDWYDHYPTVVDRYAEAYVAGDAASSDFYDPADPLIRLARSPAGGLTDGPVDLETALATADDQSQYAQVLAEGVEHLRATDAYVDWQDDGEALEARID